MLFDQIRIAIILPIHNRVVTTMHGLHDLQISLDKYYNLEVSPKCQYEIIVIDDGSSDGSTVKIKEAYPDIKILSGDGSLWWSGAINMGVKYAKSALAANYLLLWNDDIIPDLEYFCNLSDYIAKENPQIIGSTIIDKQTGVKWSGVKYFNTRSGKFMNIPTKQSSPFVYKWLTGMGTLYSSNLIDVIGLWDEGRFPQYYGDADHSLRASKYGCDILCPDNINIQNRTELSFPFPANILMFLKSFHPANTGSKWNVKIKYRFYKKHCTSILCVYEFLKSYIKHSKKYLESRQARYYE
jgi:GT2 family glycosyltransferase